ncbi:HD-like signal output (HDOD) domain, no enzymatic activity [Pseudomonas sp. URIL14HWK12:I9]|nr:HD-like signal output (HDOD) protein [Pseudomonas sp. URIL14HWK12:I12]PVZ26069.1 HD-like signal output (HDOD) protein [Pseudomonas sp. URIL14HWK12:I10]PVZ36407.1 HD-like signal output (HDOD) protein [Pseudomonas sp. URIL14HWK12:I11]SNZ18469.1 HD-like signal output (HDOD) domain, no enzymatic activity [Pseudomonas sp. URIL14HWK12:I9]
MITTLAETVQNDLLEAIEHDSLTLPTLPEVALEIRRAAEDSEISVSALSRVIGRDTALSARLIKVVNSPLLRRHSEVTSLHTAITRLGVNYTSNLATGLVIEQIFNARSPAVERTMRECWATSVAVAGLAYELSRRTHKLKPDQAALAGMVHLIGMLPILTYAEDHNDLLADPVCLNHIIDNIHPLIGSKILRSWDFPRALADVPLFHLDVQREQAAADYADLVQVASLLNRPLEQRPTLNKLPAWQRLGMDDLDPPLLSSEVQQAKAFLA